jgi:tetrapyrrole methylase family protein/MazG family protein
MEFSKILMIVPRLDLDMTFGLKLIPGSELSGRHSMLHMPDENAIYEFNGDNFDLSLIAKLVSLIYTPDYQITFIDIDSERLPGLFDLCVKDLEKSAKDFKGGYVLFRADPSSRSLMPFVELIAHLRSPEGCPWDRKQTHETLRTNILEETYEVLEAIDNGDLASLEEELGDLLLQIVLQSQVANETGRFNIYDVIRGIHNKIVFRHPHVFSDWDAKDASTVIRNWEILKSEERIKKEPSDRQSLLESVPKNLPALALAQKYQERAARVGFDWPDIAPVIDKIREEINEFIDAPDSPSRENELGDLLFAMVNLIRWHGYDAESLLRQMNQRFIKRFNFIERSVAAQGRKMTDLTLAEMDEIWEQAKLAESTKAQNEQ